MLPWRRAVFKVKAVTCTKSNAHDISLRSTSDIHFTISPTVLLSAITVPGSELCWPTCRCESTTTTRSGSRRSKKVSPNCCCLFPPLGMPVISAPNCLAWLGAAASLLDWLGAAFCPTDAKRCPNALVAQASSSIEISISSPLSAQTRMRLSLGAAPSLFNLSHSLTHIHNRPWTLSIVNISFCFAWVEAENADAASCAQKSVQHEEPRSAGRSEHMSCWHDRALVTDTMAKST